MRKVIELTAQLCQDNGITGWRQHTYHVNVLKKGYLRAQNSKKSRAKGEKQKEKRAQKIRESHQDYLALSQSYLGKALLTHQALLDKLGPLDVKLHEIESFVAHAQRQMDQIKRRVLLGETIPHEEKVFSLFEEHTEWLCKGKAGVPVELGVKVCIMEDQHQFILHHKVVQQQADVDVAVAMVSETRERFPNFIMCSFDKGFFSKNNREELQTILDQVTLPKKGKLSQKDKALESEDAFKKARQQHPAVESAINALEVHGLDRCPDQGIHGFKRYVGLAVVARNIQRVGAELIRRRRIAEKRRQTMLVAV